MLGSGPTNAPAAAQRRLPTFEIKNDNRASTAVHRQGGSALQHSHYRLKIKTDHQACHMREVLEGPRHDKRGAEGAMNRNATTDLRNQKRWWPCPYRMEALVCWRRFGGAP